MTGSALNARLLCAAELVRQDATFADIGTDHAYLPLFLLDSGRISFAYCSDINEGPLASARRNAEERGMSDKISFILTDGAAALSEKGISDYAICGMGGELIAKIIEDAPHLKREGIRLILQPMTKQEHLRRYLASVGFSVLDERYSFDSGKYYLTLLAEYTGVCRELSDSEAELGMDLPHDVDRVEYMGFLEGKRRAAKKAFLGKSAGGYETADDEMLLGMIEERIAGASSAKHG